MISVVVPTFNREKEITKSINSILNQTYKDIEVIVVDDGSTDNTEEIINGYADDRIRYIKNNSKMHGPSCARNIGILESRGEYVAFNDSDDEWHLDKLEKQLEYLQKENADVVFCVMRKNCGRKEQYIPDRSFSQKKCNLENILRGSFTGTPALLGKSESIKRLMFDEKISCNEDWELVIRLLKQYNVVYYEKNLVEVSVTEKSVSSDCNNAVDAMEYIMDKHKDLYNQYDKSLRHMRLSILYQKTLAKDIEKRSSLDKKFSLVTYVDWLRYRLMRYIYVIRFCLERV